MSITTLKRKTDGQYHVNGGTFRSGAIGYRNVISRGIFSLNDSRRVEAQHGKESIQTRMRGTGYRGHGGHGGKFIINPIRSSYQNMYDPFNAARVSRPKIVPACPVVQQVRPDDYKTKYAAIEEAAVQKELQETLCSAKTTQTTCPNVTKKLTHSYGDFLSKKKKALTRDKEHYPPMVSRNSTFVTVPNFTYAQFLMMRRCP